MGWKTRMKAAKRKAAAENTEDPPQESKTSKRQEQQTEPPPVSLKLNPPRGKRKKLKRKRIPNKPTKCVKQLAEYQRIGEKKNSRSPRSVVFSDAIPEDEEVQTFMSAPTTQVCIFSFMFW